MTYLDALESELERAGIPRRRRARIAAEFADHLHESPEADLGEPEELARQFADHLGTVFARRLALRTFALLAVLGTAMITMFLAVGRMRGLTLGNSATPTPGWAAPIMLMSMLAAQVALAAGGLALLRAWRCRHDRVISRADATVLCRRSVAGMISGALAVAALPVCALAFPRAAGHTWSTAAWVVAGAALVALAIVLRNLFGGLRLRPHLEGDAHDLISDLGAWVPMGTTPTGFALMLAMLIAVAGAVQGLLTGDPYDGIARGIVDAGACMTGFILLGRYLGLRTSR